MEEVEALRRDVVEVLDPERDMRPGESRVRHAFMESSPVQQAQLGHETIMDLNRLLLGVPDGADMTLHKSAAIVRQPGSPAVAWHSDFCGHFPLPPLNTGHVLLRSDRVPTGIWFYLSGSHPRRGGLCVIENSHWASWPGPEGFELFDHGAGKSFRRLDETPRSTSRYSRFDVPGCVPLITEPGDLILFAARTYQYKSQKASAICTRAPLPFADCVRSFLLTPPMVAARSAAFPTPPEYAQPRLSAGFMCRATTELGDGVECPWELPPVARAFVQRLPREFRRYTRGYTSIDLEWSPEIRQPML